MLKTDYKTKEDLQTLMVDYRILFAYHSNKIENPETDYHDTREVFENGKVTGFSGDPRTLFEIQNQKRCADFMIDHLIEKKEITVSLIKEIHRILTAGTYDENRYLKGERPGEFKKGDYIVGKYEIGSPASEVENDINELLDEINETKSDRYALIAAYFHARFESIHPFADGNGRVGRTLLNYYFLMHHIKPVIIYEEDKKLYYDCLQAYDEKEDIQPLERFLEYCQQKTWMKKPKSYLKLDTYLE